MVAASITQSLTTSHSSLEPQHLTQTTDYNRGEISSLFTTPIAKSHLLYTNRTPSSLFSLFHPQPHLTLHHHRLTPDPQKTKQNATNKQERSLQSRSNVVVGYSAPPTNSTTYHIPNKREKKNTPQILSPEICTQMNQDTVPVFFPFPAPLIDAISPPQQRSPPTH